MKDLMDIDEMTYEWLEGTPEAAGSPEARPRRLGRQHVVAQELGVSDKRVATWRTRSARNGFPEAVARMTGAHTRGRPGARLLWDLDEVSAWFATYDEAAQRSRRGPYWGTERSQA